MKLFILLGLMTFVISCKINQRGSVDCICLNTADSIEIFQKSLNSQELNSLFDIFGDTVLTVLGNGYIRTKYDLLWKGKSVEIISPQILRDCLNENFIIQFTRFDIINKDSVELSLWLQKQGSGANFYLTKERDNWKLKKVETYLN
jgi:hypothetical protein